MLQDGNYIFVTSGLSVRLRHCTFSGISIFFKSISTSLSTGCTFFLNWNNFQDYLMQLSLKSGGTKDHIRWVKIPNTTPY